MSNLSNGNKPGGRGPNPRRRKGRRPADPHDQANKPGSADVAFVDNKPPEDSGEGKNMPLRGSEDGSGIPAGNGNVTADNGAGNVSARKNSDPASGKQRRYPFRKHKKSRIEGMRNVRSAPQPTPDAKFDPAKAKNKGVSQPCANTSARPERKSPSRGSKYSNAYAALDLGTNNCRLLIAVPQERGRFRVVDGFSRIVRLGEGLDQTGQLSAGAMDRAVEALKICADKLRSRNIRRQRLIATEACRQAGNGEAFLKRVKAESGLDLEIVSRGAEARLAAEGCGSLMDRKSDGAVLFDIGGGSSELILVNNIGSKKKRISDRIAAWTSLPMGVVTLAERFGGQNVSRKVFDEMVHDVRTHINAFEGKEALKQAFSNGRVHLLGTSGTVTTLAGIHLKLPRYNRRQVDGIWLKDEEVDVVINRLLGMTYEERAKNPCIGQERADLVLAGCAILNAIRLTWPTKRLRVADRGLREGLLVEMMSRDGAWIKRRKDRWHNSKRGSNSARTPQNHRGQS